MREVFAQWYDFANNETDENCCIIKIDVNRVRVFRDEGKINLDLVLIKQRIFIFEFVGKV